MDKSNRFPHFENVLRLKPDAWAIVKGSNVYPAIGGHVRFFSTAYGTMVAAEIHGLPRSDIACKSPIFAFHIHEGEDCTGNAEDPFANARMHYNPGGCAHPFHAGDMPPLFGAKGYAFSVFLTNRFDVREIIGKTVIIHSSLDNFSTQPSGNAGSKIACGEIMGSAHEQ